MHNGARRTFLWVDSRGKALLAFFKFSFNFSLYTFLSLSFNIRVAHNCKSDAGSLGFTPRHKASIAATTNLTMRLCLSSSISSTLFSRRCLALGKLLLQLFSSCRASFIIAIQLLSLLLLLLLLILEAGDGNGGRCKNCLVAGEIVCVSISISAVVSM